jgi:hypothetical protein
MKAKYLTILIISFSLQCFSLYSQRSCNVLIPEIADNYEGSCKKDLADGFGLATGKDRYEGYFRKGLPDGQGNYIWSTGEIYKGEWKNGMRHGIGVYTFKYFGRDSTITGKWKNGNLADNKPDEPYIHSKSGIDRYAFQKVASVKSRVLINIFQNGARNTGVTNLMMNSTSGYDSSTGLSTGFDEVKFPVRIKLTYTTWNKLKTVTYYVEFDFEIFEAGDWKVDIHN